MKPYRGVIQNWRLRQYPEGKVIVGEFWGDHPNLISHGHPMQTSLIVKMKDDMVETLNSRYTLGKKFEEHRNVGA